MSKVSIIRKSEAGSMLHRCDVCRVREAGE